MWIIFPIHSSNFTSYFDVEINSAFAVDDPGCTNEDCPPDPGCTNEDCPPVYWADCCCHQEYNPVTKRDERICCCNEEQNVTCRWSYVIKEDPPNHGRISEIFVTMAPVQSPEEGLCTPNWLFSYLGGAWEPLSETCDWWDRLQQCPLGIIVDIKPGSDPNCFNINGHGVIPVAIYGSQDFDVYNVDPSTLNFSGLAVGIRGNGNPQCGYNDLNEDSHVDIVCQFVDDIINWKPGDGEAILTVKLVDGTPIKGSDSICIVP